MMKVFILAVVASVGGVIVARGLWLEDHGERDWFQNINDFRLAKTRAHRGLRWVFWGVILETALGFAIAVIEGTETIKAEMAVVAKSRPLLIFKGDESYVADQGATQFIKEIKFTSPAHIHIEFTKFFSSAIITPLSAEKLYVANRERGFRGSLNLNLLEYQSEEQKQIPLTNCSVWSFCRDRMPCGAIVLTRRRLSSKMRFWNYV
ncbi:MAG TPA: hypothetical protein VMR33_22720 [Candidatus Baltobacteraceae bacterium]|jgi:hypothetical protein|nr:hypothetical protein [Candidatus Baltobacteraceae bacterium]